MNVPSYTGMDRDVKILISTCLQRLNVYLRAPFFLALYFLCAVLATCIFEIEPCVHPKPPWGEKSAEIGSLRRHRFHGGGADKGKGWTDRRGPRETTHDSRLCGFLPTHSDSV